MLRSFYLSKAFEWDTVRVFFFYPNHRFPCEGVFSQQASFIFRYYLQTANSPVDLRDDTSCGSWMIYGATGKLLYYFTEYKWASANNTCYSVKVHKHLLQFHKLEQGIGTQPSIGDGSEQGIFKCFGVSVVKILQNTICWQNLVDILNSTSHFSVFNFILQSCKSLILVKRVILLLDSHKLDGFLGETRGHMATCEPH